MNRFWDKMKKAGENDCWLWNLRTNKDGYGLVQIGDKKKYAHRVAFELTHGPIDPKMVVMHTCDNPCCCNPNHLILGSHGENMRDAVNKGRTWSKLTKEQALAIRSDDRTNMAIAKDYGVNHRTVSAIKLRVIWTHI